MNLQTARSTIENDGEEITVIYKSAQLVLVVRKAGFSKYITYMYTRPNFDHNHWTGIVRHESISAEDALRWLGSEDGHVENFDFLGVIFSIFDKLKRQADFTPERVRRIAMMGERVRKCKRLERMAVDGRDSIIIVGPSGSTSVFYIDGSILYETSPQYPNWSRKYDLAEPGSIEELEQKIYMKLEIGGG